MQKRIRQRQPKDSIKPLTTSSVLNRVYSHRGIEDASELDYSLHHLLPYNQLTGIDIAVDLLVEAVYQQQRILIVGDFDADGATSSALSKLVLTDFGASHVDFLVPNRFEFGYGLSPELVDVAKQFRPDLIVTVDNGISSIAGVKAAQEAGIKVLVTDHHLAGDELPEADAIVNPNQPGDTFPSKNLAGVGVVFYVLLALRARLRELGWFEKQQIAEPNLAHYLDIVALGTVADVVPLDANNRLLVHNGLRLIRAGRCRPGISALLQLAKRQLAKVTATDLGFAVGPRLNAAGRLDDMSIGIECLLAEEKNRANELAEILHSLNSDRQQVEQEMQDEALSKLEEMDWHAGEFAHSVCLYEPHWHQGVVGLLASRIKDKVNKPCIVFANADDSNVKGSARSVKEVHIRDALALIDSRHPKLIDKFGGHAMAAGLSLSLDNLKAFQQAFEQAVTDLLNGKAIEDVIETDGELAEEELSIETAVQLAQAGPFGQGFPEPAFDGEFEVLNHRIVGENHLKLTLRSPEQENAVQAIAFRIDVEDWLSQPANRIRAVYKPDINDYFNVPELQLLIQYFERLA
ncbi:single-stranded-DNA-specific exonuclease RecJ [Kangiella sp.]|uniref:single-stranded-DNA-specific exonuclease RecJ n=1 Tax=Kangiella sp. TaxID=1920245 RepID=UPI0019C7715D|nr:single-stranded-DNA-specific exonuclease RecJ [Kangiella sp.]MBD3652487.1 single-stranded-DNA-specific exonuclease RecJ [Kangiella sp.]